MDDEIPEHGESHASSSHEPSLEPTFKRREDLGKHSVYTHFLKDRNCEICQRTKITRDPCRRRFGGAVLRAGNFGDLITADHKVLSEGCESRNNHQFAIVVQDLATQWIQAYPCKTKTSQETQRSLQKFLENPSRKPKVIYTDNSLEFGKACEESLLESLHVYTTQIRNKWDCWKSSAQSKGRHLCCIAAIGSKWKLVGRFHGMLHLSAKRHRSLIWWEDALWKTFWATFKGPIIPIGSLVEYHPITAKDQSRIHQFGKNVLPGLFLGYALYAGRIWKGDVVVADLEELETMDASEIYSKRLNAKEVIFPKQGEFIFPIADGRINLSGRDQDLRTSTLTRQRPIRGEKSPWFSWRIRRVSSTTSRLVSECRWSN